MDNDTGQNKNTLVIGTLVQMHNENVFWISVDILFVCLFDLLLYMPYPDIFVRLVREIKCVNFRLICLLQLFPRWPQRNYRYD